MNARKKICFQVLDAYSLFNKNTRYRFGGAEVRAYTFMTQLIAMGHDVSAVVRGYGQASAEIFDGVRVYPHPYHTVPQHAVKPKRLLRRFLSMRWSGKAHEEYLKYHVYNETGADVFCAFEITPATALLTEYCKTHNKRFYLFIASDGEVAEDAEKRMGTRKQLSEQILSAANKIFVQNTSQQKTLVEVHRKNGILLRNPVATGAAVKQSGKLYDVLWVGKSNLHKRPLLLLELARRLPQYSFCMVMNVSDPGIHDEMLQKKPSNVSVVEQLNLAETEVVFSQSKLFVSTSELEGFPNTFLQAGKYGVPVASMVIDPDQFLTRHQCGLVAGDNLDDLTRHTVRILQDESLYKSLSDNIRNYVHLNHDARRICSELAVHLQ